MNKPHLLHLLSSTTLILALGLIVGYSAGHFQVKRLSFSTLETIGEVNPGVTMIKLMNVEDGKLRGKIEKQKARLAYHSDGILELSEGDEFKIELSDIGLADFYIEDDLPEGAGFIASKNGKYYYSVLDKRAFNLTPANRVYFDSSDEAAKAGYLPK